jgi:cysteine desulfurase
LGLAAKLSFTDREEKNRHLQEIKKALLAALTAEEVDFNINGDQEKCVPHILNLRFPGSKSEVLLHHLEGQKIYVSQGSACHNNTKSSSETLTAMGFTVDDRDASLRFSFGCDSSVDDMPAVAAAVKSGVQMIRTMRGKK